MQFDLEQRSLYWRATLPLCSKLNARLIAAFECAAVKPEHQSHYFSGRFENIYVDLDNQAEFTPLFAGLKAAAAAILNRPAHLLTQGYWFNHMAPKDLTSLHSHDDYDELLSAVYYLKAPENSGNLVLHGAQQQSNIKPMAGMALFFDPALPHEVTRNDSDETRLSLALNYGPAKDRL